MKERISPRIIAFYLPQFHPIPENDAWWGKGFTEWTNVGKARPLFPRHYQPKVPADLGYYDLRVPETREAQAEMAREAGIEGFCYWHYWFGNGKRLLERPFNEVLQSGKPDFPFCLAWANESWEAKVWNDNNKGNKILIKQEYSGIEDYTNHFFTLLPAFKDKRYIKVNNYCLFMIYKPDDFKECNLFIRTWQKLAQENGLEKLHFVAHAKRHETDFQHYFNIGFDAVYSNRVMDIVSLIQKDIRLSGKYLIYKLFGLPRLIDFKEIIQCSFNINDKEEKYYPGIICDYDHSPRSQKKAWVLTNFNEKTFSEHIEKQLLLVKDKSNENRILFLKSWNEWGEGNYMEPDLKYKDMKIKVLREKLDKYSL